MSAIDLILAGALSVFTCQQPAITDGDGWRCLDGTKVRAWGIDAPEVGTPYGAAATRAMSDIVSGKTLICQRKGKSYDRVVAQCITKDDRNDVAALMMLTGLAQDCPRYSKGLYAGWRPSNAPILPPRHKSCEVR